MCDEQPHGHARAKLRAEEGADRGGGSEGQPGRPRQDALRLHGQQGAHRRAGQG